MLAFCLSGCNIGYPKSDKVLEFSDNASSRFHLPKGSHYQFVLSNSRGSASGLKGDLKIIKSGETLYHESFNSENVTVCNWVKGEIAFIIDHQRAASGKMIWALDSLLQEGEEYEIQCTVSYSKRKPKKTELWLCYFSIPNKP